MVGLELQQLIYLFSTTRFIINYFDSQLIGYRTEKKVNTL